MHCKNVSLIINPRTGQNVAKLPDILAVLSAAGWKSQIALKEYGRQVMKLARTSARAGSDLVIAYGGDGTLNQVVNGVMSAKKRRSIVGILPGGTANVWASEIGVPVDPVKSALTLVNSEPRRVDVGRIGIHSLTLPDGRQIAVKKNLTKESSKVRHHFLLMAGLGIDAAIMGSVSKPLKYRIGALAVGLSAAKELPVQHAFPIEIQAVGDGHKNEVLWEGQALQIVMGNTRRYAKVAQMTPEAYIDDGVLDLCVIMAGDPLSSMQQLASLLFRLKPNPENTTVQYFHGAHLLMTVPATVPLQLDGSPVKLKDYLNKSDYEKLQKVDDLEQVRITYELDALPHALDVAIPCTYDEELFEHDHDHDKSKHAAEERRANANRVPVQGTRHEHNGDLESESQKHTVAVESQPESQLEHQEGDAQQKKHHADTAHKEQPEPASTLLANGRKVIIVGKVPNPDKPHTYILAGTAQKSSTGEAMPVAVVVDGKTTIFNNAGEHISENALRELQEGEVVIVEGKRSNRGVIRATRMALAR